MPFLSAVVTAAEPRPGGVTVLRVAPRGDLPFAAGQYVFATLPGFEPRAFSIANAPRTGGEVVLHVRDMGAGLSRTLCALAAGDDVQLSAPAGAMRAQTAQGRPALMIAGGTGIAPMLALAQEIIRKDLTPHGITLIYGVRAVEDIHCMPELEALLSTGDVTLHHATGEDTPDRVLARMDRALDGHAVYMSGPEAMLRLVRDILDTKGARADMIFTDMDLFKDKKGRR